MVLTATATLVDRRLIAGLSVCCPLPTAYCLLPTAFCLLPPDYGFLRLK